MKTVTRNKMMTLAHVAELAEVSSRSVRFVIDHELVEGLRVIQTRPGGVRKLLPFDAAVAAMAASLLTLGVSAARVQLEMSRHGGAKRTKRDHSLYRRWLHAIEYHFTGLEVECAVATTGHAWLDATIDFPSLAEVMYRETEGDTNESR